MQIKAVKGVKDILPDAAAVWRNVEKQAREIYDRFGFREIVMPIFEKSELFVKSVGEQTDIVQKEMYTFTDRGGESLTLRPEGTASCVRIYIEHSMYHPPGTVSKLFYFGPMFRRERPQAGRLRQFYQTGAEFFGAQQPEADAEVIQLLSVLMRSLKVDTPTLLLNSLGCESCRPRFKSALLDFLGARKLSLCGDCKIRYEKNPLRIFDCKSEPCGETAKDAPTIDAYRCPSCERHFAKVGSLLGELSVPFVLNPRMVRGLDYYTRTVFEVTAKGLGAQNSVAGGGRYDGLVKKSGGPDVPAIGFAVGMERLIESMGAVSNSSSAKPDVYMVPVGDAASEKTFLIAGRLREEGVKVESMYNKPGSIKNQMSKAGKSGAKLALIMGEDELAKGAARIKNLSTGEQKEYRLDGLESKIKSMLT